MASVLLSQDGPVSQSSIIEYCSTHVFNCIKEGAYQKVAEKRPAGLQVLSEHPQAIFFKSLMQL